MVHNWQTLISVEGQITSTAVARAVGHESLASSSARCQLVGWACGRPPPLLVYRSATTIKGSPRPPLPADPHPERCPGCHQRILIASDDVPQRFNLNDMVEA